MKIVTMLLKYDYGQALRGESLEKAGMFPGIVEAADEVIPFWLEENGYPHDIPGLQKKAMEFADRFQPDIILFILMEFEITPETIAALSKKYITVNWFCDDHWRFENYTRIVAPTLTYSITTDKYSLQKYCKLGIRNVILSQWATHKYYMNLDVSNIDYWYDVSFIGGKNVTREWYINELKKRGIHIECFGAGWPNGRLSYEDFSNTILHSKINLNLSDCIPYDDRFHRYLNKSIARSFIGLDHRKYGSYLKTLKKHLLFKYESLKSKKRTEQMNGRTFEIPGSGGFQLGHFALEIEDYLLPGREIALYSTIDELYRQIRFYLFNAKERIRICNNGYQRTSKHLYRNRFKDIFKAISS